MSSGIIYPIGKDTERTRLKRESSLKFSNKYMADVYRNSSLYKDQSLLEQYIPFRLRFLHPKLDNELYFVLSTMLKIPWRYTDYQSLIEENMIIDLIDLHDSFTGKENAGTLDITFGDIVIYFAEFFAYHAQMSVATACELLLKNLGLIMPIDNEDTIVETCIAFGKSDCEPDHITMFDTEMYEWNSSYFNSRAGSYCVPSWLEQADYYLSILVPSE